MEIFITESQFKNITEDVRADRVNDDYNGLMSVIRGERPVGVILFTRILDDIFRRSSLKKMEVKNPTGGFSIVYHPEYFEWAKELYNIVMKYGGYFSWQATEEDSRRVSKILSYRKGEIERRTQRNKRFRGLE